MNLLDPHAYDESLALLTAIPSPKRVMVQVTLSVPVDDLDLMQCTLNRNEESYEFWGIPMTFSTYEFDPTGATFAGFPAEIADSDLDTVFNYLKERSQT